MGIVIGKGNPGSVRRATARAAIALYECGKLPSETVSCTIMVAMMMCDEINKAHEEVT